VCSVGGVQDKRHSCNFWENGDNTGGRACYCEDMKKGRCFEWKHKQNEKTAAKDISCNANGWYDLDIIE
jgi:hypothetical protein